MANKLETALAATGYPWAHHGWSRAPDGSYGVWGEDWSRDLDANGQHAERGTRCYAALFTRDDSQAPRRAVEQALDGLRCPWRLNSVQYEADTGYIHLEWVLWLFGELETPDEPEAS